MAEYGKDFTFSNGKITWLEQEADTTTTNEPASYTISYDKTNSSDYVIDGSKKSETTDTTSTTEPDNYSVKIKSQTTSSYIKSTSKTSTDTSYFDNISLNFDELNATYKEATGEDLALTTISGSTYIDPASEYRSAFNITANGQTYEYGRDFIIRTKDGSTTNTASDNFQIVWGNSATDSTDTTHAGIVSTYATARSVSGTALNAPARNTELKFSFTYTQDTTLSGKVSKTDNDKRLETVFGTSIDASNYSSLEIYGYTPYDEETGEGDFKVNDNGEIEWIETTTSIETNTDDETPTIDVTTFNTEYKNATGSELSTITLTGSDGVIRTYVNPADRDSFKLTDDDGTEYEYGRDYVIRISDDGQNYVLSWFAASDKTGDGNIDSNDANAAVTAYAQDQNISTLNFQTAPEAGTDYSFKFADSTKNYSANVKSSDEDRDLSLESLFDGLTLSTSEYKDIKITDANGKEYTYASVDSAED